MSDTRKSRKSIRLKNYDYSSKGFYFVTICIDNRRCLFGTIKNKVLITSSLGQMVQDVWVKLPELYKGVASPYYVLMPNHFHAIVEFHDKPISINSNNQANLSSVIKHFKSLTQIKYRQFMNESVVNYSYTEDNARGRGDLKFAPRLWQKSFYEHVVRDEAEYQKIVEYIQNNPLNWELDSLYNGCVD